VDPITLLRLNVIDDRFQLHSAIASGKSSKTYSGKDTNNGGRVFIKLLLFPRSDLERALFLNEAYTLRHLDDIEPRVTPKLLASGELYDGDVMYLVTEEAKGKTLAEYLQNELPLADFDSKLEVFHRVASCLTHCLPSGWNHRDLHPGNVLLLDESPVWPTQDIYSQPNPKTILLDWGQSYFDLGAQFDDSPAFMRTLYGCYFKTFTASLYSSPPEIFRDTRYHNCNASKYDSWALGLALYHILTSRDCFDFRSLGDYSQSVADKSIQKSIDTAACEIRSQDNDCSLLLSHLFRGLVCVDAATRLHAGDAARTLRDLRIEGWRPASETEAVQYIADPGAFVPQGGWKYSYLPDLDEG
jgi:serine/threonine protein kinase